MKHLYSILLIAMAVVLSSSKSFTFEKNFVQPTSDVRTAVYWYWISGNISKEGVISDLHAMKRAGINRAFIGDIGQDGMYTDKSVKIFTDEWWEVLHTALKTASELDIEIGIFNSPGWSQSGGPWVEASQAMRYLSAVEMVVDGGRQVQLAIKPEQKEFQPLRTIAYPAPKGYDGLGNYKLSVTEGADVKALPANKATEVTVSYDSPVTVRSLTITPCRKYIKTTLAIHAMVDGKWQQLTEQPVDRTHDGLMTGFVPYAPFVISLPATTASQFRITVAPTSQPGGFEKIEFSSMARIGNYAEKTLAKMCQTPLPYWDHYMWPVQPEVDDAQYAINPESVIDITNCVDSDGNLTWSAPEGRWVIMSTGMTPTGVVNSPATPEATGREIDKMSRKHVESHFDAYMGEILRRIPAQDRRTFKVVVQDSYETGGQNITDGMLEQFETTYGYSMLPYLPAYYGYTVGNQQESDRFLWDLRRFIADKVSYDYVGGLRKVSNKHGLTTWLECYGHWGFPGEFLQYGGQSDEIAGEFWSVGDLGDIENRAASSCGHIYGKKRIWAESNTSGGPAYSRTPIDMKQRTDRFFTEGINATLLHLYIQQSDTTLYPGLNAWFGNEFDSHNTWFSHFDLFTTYLKRCNYMLQQGLNIADVAYLIGEDAPKMTGMQHPALPQGYQFDYINAEVLNNGAKVKDGKITLPHGTSYKVLVLPPINNMRPGLLATIKKLVKSGAVILGTPPVCSPSMQDYPNADKAVLATSQEIWGDCFDKKGMNRYGKGMVFNGYSLEEVFAAIGLTPDCFVEADKQVLYNHRRSNDAEIYFLSNQENKAKTLSVTFRVDDGLRPELWDALNGKMRALPKYEKVAHGVKLDLNLEALGSAFVLWRKDGIEPVHSTNNPMPEKVQVIDGEWQLAFSSRFSTPDAIKLNKLLDLSKHTTNDIKYFSGTINYTTTFNSDATDGEVVLDFSQVESMAKVYVNGEYAGGVWCEPFKVDITEYVKEGANTLRVEVVNKWVNRIIGDMQRPESQRDVWLKVNPYNAQSPLPSTGIIGDVKLEYY